MRDEMLDLARPPSPAVCLIALLLLGLFGCDDEPSASLDAGACPIEVTLFVPPMADAELVVRGTIVTIADDVTVRSVRVAGVAAAADTFNFETFSAAIDRDRLAALEPPESGVDFDAGTNRAVEIPTLITVGVGGEARTCGPFTRSIVLVEPAP